MAQPKVAVAAGRGAHAESASGNPQCAAAARVTAATPNDGARLGGEMAMASSKARSERAATCQGSGRAHV
jgi:hypothetical protein